MLIALCQLADLPEGSAHGFDVAQTRLVAFRDRRGVQVYLNRCPHLGIPLAWQSPQLQSQGFLDNSGQLIRCSTHGALFEPQTGLCLQGPCRGESLWKIDCLVENGSVMIDADELPAALPKFP